MSTFGQLLKSYRLRTRTELGKRLTQTALADALRDELGLLGYSAQTVSYWENGRSLPLSEDVVHGLIAVLYRHDGLQTLEEAQRLLEAGQFRSLNKIQLMTIEPNWLQTFVSTESLSPYPGFRPFSEEDALIFFGRVLETQQIAAHIRSNPIVKLIGATGCGKTSLVQAGVIPLLRRTTDWQIVSIPTSMSSHHTLNKILISSVKSQASFSESLYGDEAFIDKPESDTLSLMKIVKQLPSPLLMIFDNWEERENEHKLISIIEECLQTSSLLHILVIARTENIFPIQNVPHTELFVSTPTRSQLQEMIVAPATSHGVLIESQLITYLIDQLQHHPKSLPYLAYILNQLWVYRERQRITLMLLKKMGDINGILGKYAETVISEYSADDQKRIHSIFFNLIKVPANGTSAHRSSSITVRERLGSIFRRYEIGKRLFCSPSSNKVSNASKQSAYQVTPLEYFSLVERRLLAQLASDHLITLRGQENVILVEVAYTGFDIQWLEKMRSRFQVHQSWHELTSSNNSLCKQTGNAKILLDAWGMLMKQRVKSVECHTNIIHASMQIQQSVGSTQFPERLSIFLCEVYRLSQVDLHTILNTFRQHTGPRIGLCFCLHSDTNVSEVQTQLQEYLGQVYACDVIALGYEEVMDLIQQRERQRILRQFILKHADLTMFSPYTVQAAVLPDSFFGREAELRKITERIKQHPYAIVGGRRIGKTSLLYCLHQRRLPRAGYSAYYLDCSVVDSAEQFWRTPLLSADQSTRKHQTLEQILAQEGVPPPVILLDEVDKLLPSERTTEWPLFNRLRGLVNNRRIYLVICGERMLYEVSHDDASPFFNFARQMQLGQLEQSAAEELIIRPLKQLEIDLQNPQSIVHIIYNFAAGHPNIIQRLCDRLIQRLNERRTRRLTIHDVQAVISAPDFQRTDFLETYWEGTSPLERIITLVMVEDETVRTLTKIRTVLSQQHQITPSARMVDEALRLLTDVRGILTRTSTGYQFHVTAFSSVLANKTVVSDLLEIYVEEFGEQQDRV